MSKPVLFVAHLPPPVHGMAMVSEWVLKALQSSYELDVVNTSPGSLTRSIGYHLKKATAVWRALRKLSGEERYRALYLPLDAGKGLYYARALAKAASRHGVPVWVHHHNRSYIAEHEPLMEALLSAVPSIQHIFLSESMAREYQHRYGAVDSYVVIGNARWLEIRPKPIEPQAIQAVGMLSNLSVEKGLEDALAMVSASDFPVSKFHFAGPVEPSIQAKFHNAISQSAKAQSWGPVYDQNKEAFWEQCSVLIFPSRLDEAQSLTILEALSRGIPVIARNQAGNRELLGDDYGGLIDSNSSFASEANLILKRWQASPENFNAACINARERFKVLKTQASEGWSEFLSKL